METGGNRNSPAWADFHKGENTAGPKYTDWGQFADWLLKSGMKEVDFTVEFGLGFYATREWKRRNRVPLWAVVALSRASFIREASVTIESHDIEQVLATTFLNPDEFEEWEALNKRRGELLKKATLAREADEQLAATSKAGLQLAAFPEFDPKKPPDL